MLKKLVVLVSFAAVAAVVLSGCGKQSTTTRSTAPGGKTSPATAPAGKPSPEAKAPAKPGAVSDEAKKPGAAPALAANATAKDILLRTAGIYKSAKSLKLEVTHTQTMSAGGKSESVAAVLNVKFARPNKMSLTISRNGESMQIVTNGSKQIMYNSSAKQYQVLPAPKDIFKAAGSGEGFSTMSLLGGAKIDYYLKKAKLVGSEKIGGRDTYVIAYAMPADKREPGLMRTEKIWIGKSDGLIYQITSTGKVSAKALAAGAKKGQKLPKGPFVVTEKSVTKSVALNPSLASGSFQFTPPKGVTKFDREKAALQMKKQMAEVEKKLDRTGDKAPAFSLTSIDGKQVSSADYQGKPLVVVFWTSLSPSAKKGFADMSTVQSTLRGNGIGLVAVTLDSNKSAAEKLAKESGISFPVLMCGDKAVEIGNNYGVMYLPTVFIIDKQGVIRDKVISETPGAEVAAKLAKLGLN